MSTWNDDDTLVIPDHRLRPRDAIEAALMTAEIARRLERWPAALFVTEVHRVPADGIWTFRLRNPQQPFDLSRVLSDGIEGRCWLEARERPGDDRPRVDLRLGWELDAQPEAGIGAQSNYDLAPSPGWLK